jgi:hypothetical protein
MKVREANLNVFILVMMQQQCKFSVFNTAFGPAALDYVYSSYGEGTLTIIKEISKNKYEVIENIPTKRGARALVVDDESHTR